MTATVIGWSRMLVCACLALGIAAGIAPLRADVDGPPVTLERSDAVALVRATFVRLNDANLTADYAMLRATGAPDFQKRFSEVELAALFAGMRAKQINLSRAVALDPVIEAARYHTGQNILQLVGYVETSPLRTRFGFSYQKLDGVWRLYGLTLDFEARPLAHASPVI